MNKIFISVSSFCEYDKEPLDILKKSGLEAVLNPYNRRLNPAEVVSLGKECVGMLAGLEDLGGAVLSQLPNLKVISRVGVGTDNIDLVSAKRLNIAVCNTPDAPTESVAELAIGLAFDLLRKISLMDRQLRNGNWKRISGSLIKGKVIGIIGLGRIGKRVAELLSGFDASIIASDIVRDDKWLKDKKVSMVVLEEVFRKSDIIMLHLSGNSCIIGKKEISAMKRGVYIVNLSRGAIIDESALYEALKDKHIAGAALDVFCEEPYKGPLKELEDVILTPHIGSHTRESRIQMELEASYNLVQALKYKGVL